MVDDKYRRLTPICTVAECGRRNQAHGLCNTHYSRWRKTGTASDPAPFVATVCSVDGCAANATRKGLCGRHYSRARYQGVDNPPLEPILKARADCNVAGCTNKAKGFQLCQSHLDRLRKYGDPAKSWRDVNPKPPCSQCGEAIPSSFHSRAYCSDRCTKRAKDGRPDKVTCAVCGTLFRQIEHAKTCTPACAEEYRKRFERQWFSDNKGEPAFQERRRMAQQRRRVKLRGLEVEKFSFREIAERDRWRCGICGERVDAKKRHPDPRSGSLDHILPVNQGGAHTRLNVQIAHLLCNMKKSDRPAGQMLLVG